MRKLILALVLLSVAGSTREGHAQQLPLDVELDYATFLYDADESLLEIYLSVGAADLDFELTDGRYLASLPLGLELRPVATSAPAGVADQPVLAENIVLRFAALDTAALLPGQFYVEQLRAAVPGGEYTLSASFEGTADRPEVSVEMDVDVPIYGAADRVTVSGVTLATHIARAEAEQSQSSFYKNGLIVTPNPKNVYGQNQSRVMYYLEAYGLAGTGVEEYTLLAFLSGSNLPQAIEGYQERSVRAARDPDVLVGSFDVSELPTGSYFLRVALLSENNEAFAEQSKKLFVLNPDVARPTAIVDEGFETSFYAVMSEEEVEENVAHAKVIATQSELRELSRLNTLEEKRTYLARFWQSRDSDSDPAANSARKEFYERLQYADRYSTPFEDVWETDRARVLLKYGYPSEVDPRPFDQQLVPHEIWSYDSVPGQGAATFVFADREGLGRFDLIHSTVTGEVSAPNWQELLQR